MKNQHILTVEDLVKFCQNGQLSHFSSKDSGYSLRVQIPCEHFEIDDETDPFTLMANIKLMHTGRNRNESNLTEKAAKNCLGKIAYKPILADFTDINGERDFTYHAMEFNEDGSRTYIERQVGCFTADKPYMKKDDKNEERFYIYAKAAIPREYTDAAEIIERKGGTKVSAELSINEMSYSIEDGLLLEDVEVMGCTLLGTDPDTGNEVQEGMQGAYLQIEDFSENNNSVINTESLINEITAAVLKRLDDKSQFSATDLKEGGCEPLRKFDELLEKYGKTVEEITFEYKNMTDEELETAFAEAFETQTENEDNSSSREETFDGEEGGEETGGEETGSEETGSETGGTTTGTETGGTTTGTENGGATGGTETGGETVVTTDDDHQSTSAIEDEDSTGTKVANSLNYSVTIDGVTKEFSVSLQDKINALTILCNDMYSETDNTWYYVDVYDEDKYVVMHDFWMDKHYRQSYAVKKDTYSLKGERVPVFTQYLSQDEINQLDKMKSDFSAIEAELSTYKQNELHIAREAVLNSEDYAPMVEFAEFKELQSHMDEYSVEELTEKADLIYAKFMKTNYSTFAGKGLPKKRGMVLMNSGSNNDEERLPYGGLFKNFKNKNKPNG